MKNWKGNQTIFFFYLDKEKNRDNNYTSFFNFQDCKQ